MNAAAGSLEALESALSADIAAASDEMAVEAVRVAALGKKGTISELLKTLGTMTPEERQAKGPAINGLKTRITEALAARRAELKDAAIVARLAAEKVDVTLPVRQSPAEAAASTPSARSSTRSRRSSATWASQSPRGRTSRPTTTTSPR